MIKLDQDGDVTVVEVAGRPSQLIAEAAIVAASVARRLAAECSISTDRVIEQIAVAAGEVLNEMPCDDVLQ